MNALPEVIYQIATAMLAPALAALLTLFGWSLFTLGGLLGEWRRRHTDAAAWADLLATSSRSETAAPPARHDGPRGGYREALRADAPPEKTLADLEVAASARLAWLSFGVRIGPLLGLMGTLIPMGPALVGLSEGDIEALAGNLVIVFSTTVLGVFVGGLCYAMLLARRQWYARDLADIESALSRTPHTADDSVDAFTRFGEPRRAQ